MFSILDYTMSLTQRSAALPLHHLKHWRPFKLDALGLMTLLGADEVNKSIGTLQRRHFTECTPLLAAFTVAGDQFTEIQPGNALYNITDGMHTTELQGWFTRWLSAQEVRKQTTIFRWTVEHENRRQRQTMAPVIAVVATLPLLICTVLIGDWFGLGNALAIIFSVLVRQILLWQRRTALNSAAAPEEETDLPLPNVHSPKRPLSVDTETKLLHRESSEPSAQQTVTLFVTRADGRMVTIYTPRSILSTFIRDMPLPAPNLYHFWRWFGWAAYGAHIIVLGMSSMFTQLYTVFLLVFSTWILCHSFDMDIGRHRDTGQASDGTTSEFIRTRFTSRLVVQQENPAVVSKGRNIDKRMYAYVRAQPWEKQEAMLKHWSMLPFEGVPWYDEYAQAKAEYQQNVAAVSGAAKQSSEGWTSPSMSSRSTSPELPRSPPRVATSP